MWLKALFNAVVVPAASRVGTVVASLFVGWGATQPDADAIALGLVALAGFLVDLLARKALR